MIEGIGIDVVDISRFQESLDRTPALREKLFTSREAANEMADEASKHPNATLLWVQDEPANQGPYPYIGLRTANSFNGRTLRRVSRRATASPATGSHHLHEEEQNALIMEAFTR